MKQKIFLITLLIITITTPLQSQYYTSGEDKASIQWRKIETPHFRLVFPSSFESEGQNFASLLESAYPKVTYSLHYKPKPITILIHSQSAYSNGFVTWAPRRMEIFPTPHQSIYAQKWLEQLALHESRHVVQISSLNRGFTRFMSYLFGQQATGAVAGAYIPMWFFEGDATTTETLLSESGRGRQPSFGMELKAQLIDKQRYSYNKAYLGSYGDFVPDYYVMGYHLVTGARQRYGNDIWENALKKTGSNSWYPFIFSHEIKKATGMNKNRLYQSVFDSLQQVWRNEDKQLSIKPGQLLSNNNGDYKNFQYPHPLDNGTIIAELSGPSEVNRFVKMMADGSFTTLYTPGNRNPEPFSLANNKLVWSELQENIRWEQAKTSVVKVLDLATHKVKTVSHRHEKVFAPALSPDGSKIAWIRMSNDHHCHIDIVDYQTTSLLKTFDVADDYLITSSWADDNKTLVMIRLTNEGKQLVTLDAENGMWTSVMPATHNDIQHPVIQNNIITYSTQNGEFQNIYSYHLITHQIKQLTNERFGAFSPVIKSDSLYYSRYTANGYQLAKCDTSSVSQQQETYDSDNQPLYQGLEKEENILPHTDTIQQQPYEVKKYSKLNLLNFHSWAPAYINIGESSVKNGISFMSQNLLNTMVFQAGYNADPNYRNEKFNASISYTGWFPKLSLTIKMGDTPKKVEVYQSKTDTFSLNYNQKIYHYQIKPGISFPFNLSRGAWTRQITPSANYNLYKVSSFDYLKTNGYIKGNTFYAYPNGQQTITNPEYLSQGMEYDLFAYNFRKGTIRDVDNRWGQLIEVNYRHTPWGGIDKGDQLALFTRLYLPGIMKYHALRLENDWQWRNTGEKFDISNQTIVYYRFSSIVSLPRGYDASNGKKIYSFKGDYSLPLFNPDFSLGGIMYLKRVTGTLFYDYSFVSYQTNFINNTTTKYTISYQSYGGDIMTEVHLARFILPIGIGARYAWMPNERQSYTQLLLRLNLSGFLPFEKHPY
jgi:hypothetical protein